MVKLEGINFNATDKLGLNAFWLAAYSAQADVLRVLYSSKIDTLVTDKSGSNALHIAVKKGNLEVVKTLV